MSTSRPMRPSFKKWREKPCHQVALFIRTKSGRTVEISADKCTRLMEEVSYDLLHTLCSGKRRPKKKKAPTPKSRGQRRTGRAARG